MQSNKPTELFPAQLIRAYAQHLKVLGAYVQKPTPTIVGLGDNEILMSSDASSLYPTSIIYSNIGYDTIRHRIYDPQIVDGIIKFIEFSFKEKKKVQGDEQANVIKKAKDAFRNALLGAFREFDRIKKVQQKKEVSEFISSYYPHLFERILKYQGNIQDIYNPKNDETYYLLKSCLHPILEAITWINPQNRGYNKQAVEYVFFNKKFIFNKTEVFAILEINSVKSKFVKLTHEETRSLFEKYIINPYGILFDKHDDNLAYDVDLLIRSLNERKIYKNQMLVLKAIIERWDYLSKNTIEYLNSLEDGDTISEEYANTILSEIEDREERQKRIKSLTAIEIYRHRLKKDIKSFFKLRANQLDIVQKGIKVAANSAYGIFGLITWQFANPLIGNAITNAGKIYGIKLFQVVVVDTIEKSVEIMQKEGIV